MSHGEGAKRRAKGPLVVSHWAENAVLPWEEDKELDLFNRIFGIKRSMLKKNEQSALCSTHVFIEINLVSYLSAVYQYIQYILYTSVYLVSGPSRPAVCLPRRGRGRGGLDAARIIPLGGFQR